MGGYDAKSMALLYTAIVVVRFLHLEREEPNLVGAGLFMSWMMVARFTGFVQQLLWVASQQGWGFACVVRLRLGSRALCDDASACTVNFLHELLWVAALRGWRFAGVACMTLALWVLCWTLDELLRVLRLIIYYPELMVEPLVGLLLHLVCAMMRLLWRVSRVVCAMAGAMAGTREFRNIMVAVSIAAIVIVAEMATVGYDGIVLAVCEPDLRLELGAVVASVGWYILLGFWHRAAHCPWQQCSTQVSTSQRSTTMLRCYRLPRHPGIVRRLVARHRPVRRRHCAKRLAWAPMPLFGGRPRRGPWSRVRCIIRRRLPRPQRSAWRPTRYSRAAPQRGPGPARQSRQQRRRMRALAAAMCWCPRPVGGRGEPVYDGDCEIPLQGEDDSCKEGADSDVGERLEVEGDWDESYCAPRGSDAQPSCACGSPCVATTSTPGSGPPASPCAGSSPQPLRDPIGGGLPPCAMARGGDPRPRAYLCVEQADCLVGNPSAWVAFVRGKIDELVNAAPDKFSDNIYYAMLMLQARVGPVVPWTRSASETLLAEVAGYWAHGFVQAATALVGDPLQCMASLRLMLGILQVRKCEFSWDDYCMAVTSIQNNLRYWETLRVQMERQGCDTMNAAPVAGRKFQTASAFLEAALACDGTVGERLVTVEHYLRIVEGRRDVLYGADYEPAVAQLKELLRYWMERSGGQVAETAQGDVQVLQPTAPTQVSVAACATLMTMPAHAANASQPGLEVVEPQMSASAAMTVDVGRFNAASEFLDAAFTGAANVWERLARIQYLLHALEKEKDRFPAKSVDAAMRSLKDAQGRWKRKWSGLDEVQKQRLQSGSAAIMPHGSIPLHVRPAVEAPGVACARVSPAAVASQAGMPACVRRAVGVEDVDTQAVDFVDFAKSFARSRAMLVEEKIARLESLLEEVQRWNLHKTDPETIEQRDMADAAGVQAQGNAGRRDAVVDNLDAQHSDGKRPVDDVAPVTKETQRQKNKRENDEMKKFGMTLAEVRRLSRCLDTGDYAGFGMRPFKLRPLTDDPSAAHPYSLDEHRERSKCPKCHAPMFKEEEPKRSRCCSKGKAKVLEPNLNLIIEKRRRRERLLAEVNADERELARNELTHQEEMLWQIHCNPTNVALWIRYGRMINQFFAVARVVASGRIGDSVKNKGACVLELHGQTVERIKPIIRDGVHVNNDFFFLLDKPGKDEAQEDVLKRCEVKERDPNLRKLLDLLEEYLLTYNPLLQQFARQATEELEQRQASVEVAGQFSPEVHAPEIFLLPS
eukprot:jgi/Mesvir1/17684/Mv10238-RA.1